MPDGSELRPMLPQSSSDLRQRRQHVSKPTVPTVVDEDWGEMTSQAIRDRCIAGAPRNPLHRHPVLRTIYLLFFVIATLLILLPAWTLLYLPRRNRPRESWTIKRCLRVRWSRRMCAVVARCELDYLGRDMSKPLDPLKLAFSHQVTVPPAPAAWLRGHPATMLQHLHATRGRWHPQLVHRIHRDRAGVWGRWNPAPTTATDDEARTAGAQHESYGFAPVPAFWFDGRKATPTSPRRARTPGQPVMLYFHGGGYMCGTAAETDVTSSIPKSMVEHTPVDHVLSVDYRLAPTAPWPLPLLDAISAYAYLVLEEGVDERDLVLGGDSAGGHLALALARWLRDEGPALGLRSARCLVLLSPWSDLGFTHQWGTAAMRYNTESDTIDNTFGPFASSLLLRALPGDIMHTSAYVSPASRLLPADSTSFARFPPAFVVHGGAERLAPEITELFARIRMAREGGGGVDADETEVQDRHMAVPDTVHDFTIFPWFAAEAGLVYAELDGWLRSLLAGDGSRDASDAEGDADDPEDHSFPPPAATLAALDPLLPAPPSPARTPRLSPADRLARRSSLRLRSSWRDTRSPRLPAVWRDTPRRMVGDMRAEGMHLLSLEHVEPLELGAALVAPFTAQYERGEWAGSWEEGAGGWCDVGAGGEVSELEEDEDDE